MSAIQELVGEIRVDHSGVSKGVSKAQDDMDSLGSKAQSVGSSMQSAGKSMTMGLTAPIAAAGAASLKMAADFEGAMQQSIAIMGDVSDAEREQLEETARDVAKSTTASHEEAAESYYFLASAGMDAAESMEAMPQVAAYAESAQLDMATATDYSTDIMSAFGYEASELAEVTDTLTQAVSNHNTTAEGMGNAMSYVAPVAESVGMSIQETAAAIGMFSDVGIKGSKAGTSLRTAISNLSAPTEKQQKLLDDLGVSVTDSEGNMRSFADIVRDLENAGADTADIMNLFGKEAGPAMQALLKQGADQLEENTQALEDAEGATQEVAQTQRDTLHGSIAMTKSAFADVAIELGSELIPFMRILTDVLTKVADNWGGMNPMLRKGIIAFGALVAVIGPLLMVFGTILTMIPSMVAGFGVLAGVLGAPIVLPILAIVGAIGLLAAAWSGNWGDIRGKTAAAVSFLRGKLGGFEKWLTGPFASGAQEAQQTFTSNMGILKNKTLGAWDDLKSGSVSRWNGVKTAVSNGISGVEARIDNFISGMYAKGEALVTEFTDGIKSLASKPGEIVDDITSGIGKFLPSSAAERGELSDLDQRGPALVDTLADPMEAHAPRAERAASTVASAASPEPSAGSAGGQGGGEPRDIVLEADTGNKAFDEFLMEVLNPKLKEREEINYDQITGGIN